MKFLILFMLMCPAVWAGQLSTAYPGLILLWHMNEGTGSTAYDTKQTYDGVNTAMSWVTGLMGGGVQYTGATSSIRAVNNTGLPSGSSPRTVMVWLKRTTTGNFVADHETIFMYGSDTVNDYGFGIFGQINATTLEMFVAGVNNYSVPEISIADTMWHHIAITYATDYNIRIYYDGTLKKTNYLSTLNTQLVTANKFTVGNYMRAAVAVGFKAKFDDGAVFNRELKSGEIARIYQEGVGRHFNAR